MMKLEKKLQFYKLFQIKQEWGSNQINKKFQLRKW
jgi:hypothetical protein